MKPNSARSFLLACLIMTILAASGCRDEPSMQPASSGQGKVWASSSYVAIFGQPPSVNEGESFAYVGYYPAVGQAQKLRPFPLFLFNREKHPQIIVEQLLSWGDNWDLGGVFSDPFPPGSALVSLRQEGDLARVEFSSEVVWQTDGETQRAIAALVGHSMLQFEGINRVMVVAGGRLLPGQAERGFVPDPQWLAEVGPPVPLTATVTREEGEDHVVELSVFFDRPLRIDTFRLTGPSGKEIEGKYYRSVFDMAVVIHPAYPDEIIEGMPLQLTWSGKDFLGRKGGGVRDFTLGLVEHP